MSTQTQFGHTLFLKDFQDGSAPERLDRLPFSTNASQDSPYDEKWLQRLIMRHPSLLPVDQIELAFNPLIPICIELPMLSGNALDNLFVTPTGGIALVECKLWRNSGARRDVVAQIINYAKEISGWTYEMLQDAIRRTKPLDSEKRETHSLYELVPAKPEIDEASFHDTVSRNLKRGRFLLLIVGDGIHEGVESLTEFLQQHAGFHFTLAFVEIALFKAPGGYIAQPRVLAKTKNIDRGVVTMDEGRIVINAPDTGQGPTINSAKRTSITQEQYFEQLDKELPGIPQRLEVFLNDLASYGVSADFGTECMILRWRPDDGKTWNLGTLSGHGQVYMDTLSWQASNAGLAEILKQYLQKLASLVPGADVKKGKNYALGLALNGRTVTLNALLADDARRNGWVDAIADFQAAVMKASHDD